MTMIMAMSRENKKEREGEKEDEKRNVHYTNKEESKLNK